jgi:hypothetical protein
VRHAELYSLGQQLCAATVLRCVAFILPSPLFVSKRWLAASLRAHAQQRHCLDVLQWVAQPNSSVQGSKIH